MDGGTWWAALHGVVKSRTRLSDFTFTFHFPALEKDMATHSSVLAWRIPGTGEPGGLPSMGPHRVGHDWSDWAAAAAARGGRHVTPWLPLSSSPLRKDIKSVWNHWVQMPCLLQTARPLQTSWAPGLSMMRSKPVDIWRGTRGCLFWAERGPHFEPPCAGTTLEIPAFGSPGVFYSTPIKF